MSTESALSAGVSLHGHQSRAPYGSLSDKIHGAPLAVLNSKLPNPVLTGRPW